MISPDRAGGVSRGQHKPGRDEGLNCGSGKGTAEFMSDKRLKIQLNLVFLPEATGEARRAVEQVTEFLGANRRAESSGIRLPGFIGGR